MGAKILLWAAFALFVFSITLAVVERPAKANDTEEDARAEDCAGETGEWTAWAPMRGTVATWSDDPASERTESRVSRTEDRVYVGSMDGAAEWLYVRDPIDPRRQRAAERPRGRGIVILYTATELADRGLDIPWSRRAGLGIDAEELIGLEGDGFEEIAFGIRFERLVPKEDADDSEIAAVWWNEELGIPLRVVRRRERDTVVQELTSLKLGADEALLRELPQRHPELRVVVARATYRETVEGR